MFQKGQTVWLKTNNKRMVVIEVLEDGSKCLCYTDGKEEWYNSLVLTSQDPYLPSIRRVEMLP